MRLVIQRVKSASCMIDEAIFSEIKQGLLVFVGIEDADTAQDISYAVRKIVNLRIFSDADGKMNLSVKAIADGSILPNHVVGASIPVDKVAGFVAVGKEAVW